MTPQQALAAVPEYQEDPQVLEAQTQAQLIVSEARELQIIDEATNQRGLTLLSQCRTQVKGIDALRKHFVEPLNTHVKNINAFFAGNAAPLKEADQILARKTSDYRMKVAEAARKEQERQRLLAERRQERAAAKAAEKGVEPPPVMPLVPTVAAPAKTVETGTGAKITYRKQSHFEVTDAAAVPREYLSVDEKKIGAAVRAGIATPENPIPGVRIWITEEATVR